MGLSKKKRFEVFKRDNFTCQYCGSKAPDVILECDHINPKSKGGKDEIINLITSCKDCNRGKSNKELSDTSEIEKQRQQIEELNEKRKQIDMILEWKEGLRDVKNYEINRVEDYFNSFFNEYAVEDEGKATLKKLLKKYGLNDLLEAIDSAHERYSLYYTNEWELFETMIKKIGAILYYKDSPEYEQDIAYIKGICKNRFLNKRMVRFGDGVLLPNWQFMEEVEKGLREYYKNGGNLEAIKSYAKEAPPEDFYDAAKTEFSFE